MHSSMMYPSLLKLATFLAALTCIVGYVPSMSRRNVLQGMATLFTSTPGVVNALEACNPKANNCVFTTWIPPAGKSTSAAIADFRAVIAAYPQEGQGDVDGGGWAVAEDKLDSDGTARVEYRSSGTGFFAKAFNGGKPFVDDLNVGVDASGSFQVRSQSRIGDSDLGVNAKRVKYLATQLGEKSWNVESP